MPNYPDNFLLARNDLLKIDPRELQIDETKYNGRWKPLDDEVVRDLAINMIEIGQQQPIRVRSIVGKGSSRVFTPTLGFNRTRAAIMINNDPELIEMAKEKGRVTKEGIFPLDCVVINVNEREAFIQNVVENARRRNTSPVDDAHNHEKMREMGYKDADIARIVGVSQSRISQLKQLLLLEDRYQELIHIGDLSVESGIGLVNLEPDVREKLVPAFVNEDDEDNEKNSSDDITLLDYDSSTLNGKQNEEEEDSDEDEYLDTSLATLSTKVNTPSVRKSLPKKTITKAKRKANVAKKIIDAQREQGIAVKRTLKEIRQFFEKSTAPTCDYGVSDASIKHLIRSFHDWTNGLLSDDDLINEIVDTFEK